MNTDFMKGVVVPILTVIDEEEKIDEAGQRAQVDYVIEGGVSGILAFGSNGEFYMVEEDEMARILMKIEKEKIREIVIISLEKDEVSFIRIKGAIDPEQLNAIIENNK